MKLKLTHQLFKIIDAFSSSCKSIGDKNPLCCFVTKNELIIQMKEMKLGRSFLDARYDKSEFISFEVEDEDDDVISFEIKANDLCSSVDKMDVSWTIRVDKNNVLFKQEQANDDGVVLRKRQIIVPFAHNLKIVEIAVPTDSISNVCVRSKCMLNEIKALGNCCATFYITSPEHLSISSTTESIASMVKIPIEEIVRLYEKKTPVDERNEVVDIEYLIKILTKLKPKYKTMNILIPTDTKHPICVRFGDHVSYYMVRRLIV